MCLNCNYCISLLFKYTYLCHKCAIIIDINVKTTKVNITTGAHKYFNDLRDIILKTPEVHYAEYSKQKDILRTALPSFVEATQAKAHTM